MTKVRKGNRELSVEDGSVDSYIADGYQIIDARNNIRADILLATILVIGIIGILLDGLLKLAEKLILRSWGGAQ